MIKIIEVKEGVKLNDYSLYSSLAMAVRELKHEASTLMPMIIGKKVWMVNSTGQGGGVAEMMPRLVSLFRQLGIEADWVVADSDDHEFFDLTKRIHNSIHGEQCSNFTKADQLLYEAVNKNNAEELLLMTKPDDLIVIHDPQPLGMAKFIKNKMNVKFIWRCHIGIDKKSTETDIVWEFLRPYTEMFNVSVFSSSDYIPGYLADKSIVMHPSIDPLDHKNRDLPIHKVVGILCDSNLVTSFTPRISFPFTDLVKRLQPDGSFQSPLLPQDMGLLYTPSILQISRWDRLKGFIPLMEGFIELKKSINTKKSFSDRNFKRLQLAQLILAGPDPDFVNDDPEGKEVLNEIRDFYLSVDPSIQPFIAILKLPMSSRKENELIVNALQRVSSLIVQNSLKEGFGLTVTEALWKIKPVVGTHAYGIKQQIRDGLDGILIDDPLDKCNIAEKLIYALDRPKEREVLGYNGQKRVIENFLIFTQIKKWLLLFATI